MEKITANIKGKDKEYNIFLGSAIFPELMKNIKENYSDKKLVVITDETISKLHKGKLDELSKLGYILALPSGEQSKTRETKAKVEDMLLDKGYGRDTLIVSIGGGVICDLSGYVASTYNRGIPIIQVPTTLLSMVDASVGGKTGINTKHGKNLIGAFYQPDAVFADIDFLSTLPEGEFLNGLVEAVKISITSDKELFSFIESNVKKILSKDEKIMLHLVKRSIELKKGVVEKDEKESGLRQILNLGHTIGHALEVNSEFKEKHGFCVSKGIIVELRISESLGELQKDNLDKIIKLINDLKLPSKIDKNIQEDKLIGLMVVDKKSKQQKPYFVIVKEIGKVKSENNKYSFSIEESAIKKSIELSKND